MIRPVVRSVAKAVTGGGGAFNWLAYWASQPEVLFFGLYSDISGGQMPNRVTGSSDYLTVAGAVGSETYQCPNTAPYIAADTDYLWFQIDTTLRTVTTAELIGYDIPRTPVKYEDNAPNEIIAIMILKAGSTITGTKYDRLFRDMWLPILWDGILNAYGHIKSNRIAWNPWPPYAQETQDYISGLVTPLSDAEVDIIDTLVKDLKLQLGSTNLSDDFDRIRIPTETSEASLRNLVRRAFDATNVNADTFVALEGFTGNGINSYLNTNYNAATQGSAYTLNSCSMGEYIRTLNQAKIDLGVSNGVQYSRIVARNGVGKTQLLLNESVANLEAAVPLGATGFFIGSRTAVNARALYRNGAPLASDAQASESIPSFNFYEGAINNWGGAGSHSTAQKSISFHGRGFSAAEVVIITNIFEAFMDAHGRGVI